MQIIVIKLTLYLTKQMPPNTHTNKINNKKKITLSFPGRYSKEKIPPKHQTSSIPYLLQAQPALVLRLLACYCGSITMCRQNGSDVNPNHADSEEAS